jgi:membrane fusion protein, multidrug efflux system
MKPVVDDSRPAATQPVPARPKRTRPKRTWVAAVAALLIALLGALWIAAPRSAESTDNAYLQADSAVVAPRVRGLIAAVLVKHNQRVSKGDPLVRIDAEEFDARVASAQAALRNSAAGTAAANAALVTLDAEERLATSTIRAAQTTIRSYDAQQALAESDRRRYEELAVSGAVARRDVDQYRAAEISAQANAARGRATLAVSRDEAAVTRARRQSLQASLDQAQAIQGMAQAALDLALQDQANTLVRAPIDGVVADRQVESGDYVQPGSRLLTVVPIDALYVIANFKETQTERMVVGQRARIAVDALPGQLLGGQIESFAPGSGSQFSLLPFEPGTGNFTKIVQRVAVRIRFDPNQAALGRLRAGLSSTVTVSLEGETNRQARR